VAASDGFAGQRVVVLGLARQGTALAHYLVRHGAEVVVSDLRPADHLQEALDQLAGIPVETVLGGHPSSLLDGADLLCLSAGVSTGAPIVKEAQARGIPLSNDSQIFLMACPATVIGITGSAGKTTTTALVGEMCRMGGRRTWVGGNIGRSMLVDLEGIRPEDVVVMELSSFQLEIMTRSVAVGAILNLTPNHLDRHKTMEAYTAAKARLLHYQSADDLALLGRDDRGAWALRSQVRGRLRAFSLEERVADGAFLGEGMIMVSRADGEQPVCPASELRLLGRHNVLNALAATALADAVGVPVEAMAEASRTFAGVEHRLELVRERSGIRWYDDSIATAPERMMAALRSFVEPLVLLAGGRDKDLPWEEAACLVGERVRDIVLFGEAAALIRSHLDRCRRRVASSEEWRLERVVQVDNLEQAVEAAAGLARPGDVVLMSPGGTSFDAYRDFNERGDHFQELVRRL
jgi:UDP-N-acetylmuramoylalanine--D-glutamate ligase